mgnify:CR=1 FL=1
MESYKHILVAVDFSEHSEIVGLRAKALSEQFKAKLSVMHVTENLPMGNVMDGQVLPIDMELSEQLMELSQKRLAELGDKLGIAKEDQWIVTGSPQAEIVSLAEDNNVDLIIVGSHGRHGFALLLGSTANGV